MSEFDEFAEALMGQLSVEIDEEKVIEEFAKKINEDRNFTVKFDDIEMVSQNLFADLVQRVSEYMGLEVSKELSIEYIKLDEFSSAILAFEEIVEKYFDTEYFGLAHVAIIQCHALKKDNDKAAEYYSKVEIMLQALNLDAEARDWIGLAETDKEEE